MSPGDNLGSLSSLIWGLRRRLMIQNMYFTCTIFQLCD